MNFHPHARVRTREKAVKSRFSRPSAPRGARPGRPSSGRAPAGRQRAAIAAAAPAITVPVVRLIQRMARGLVNRRRARAASPI